MMVYFECRDCGKQSKVKQGGTIKCPHCGASAVKQLELTSGNPPDWFKDSKRGFVHDFCQRVRNKIL